MRMMVRNSFKLWVCMACLASSVSAPAQPLLQMDLIDLAAISRMTPQQLEVLAEGLAAQEMMRTKRSSIQAVASASKASSGLASKVGFLGQASAGAVSLISSASSKSGHDDHPGYSYEPHEAKVDFWGLKKSILYTLFQAVKAITGGVTILKGQLIKGGGALASTFGKVISVKGEAVSNLGKKIVSSAALSTKQHHHSPPVYGPPAHIDYPPTGYSAPTAPAHYQHTAPSAPAPTGFAAHKYPSHLDGPTGASLNQIVPLYFPTIGRSKLNGVHAGLVFLAPLGDDSSNAIHHAPTGPAYSAPSHTPLEPPSSILHSAFSAIKDALSHVVPSHAVPAPAALTSYATEHHEHHEHQDIHEHPPPPPQPVPPFKPMQWPAFNSYGEPASPDSYSDYSPLQNYNTVPSYDHYAAAKHSKPHHYHNPLGVSHGLTPEKLHKIQKNLDKLAHLNLQRSSEEQPQFNAMEAYRQLFEKGMPLMPTPVVSDAEIGVLPAAILPTELPHVPSSSSPPPSSSTVTTTTTTAPPTDEKTRRRKEAKFFLRGNKIVIV